MRRSVLLGLVIFLGAVFAPNAYAHYSWVTVDNYYPKPDEEITISIVGGHCLGKGKPQEASMFDEFYLVTPEGQSRPLKIEGEGERDLLKPVKIRLEREGTYLVVAIGEGGFITKTTKGVKRQSKEGLKSVLESFWNTMCAKAIVVVGESGGEAFRTEAKQKFELVPQKDPGHLTQGDMIPIELKLDGKSYRHWIYGTYRGFSEENDTFAYATRSKGPAKVKLLKAGTWLILAWDRFPYPDPKKADLFKLKSTLTFGIR